MANYVTVFFLAFEARFRKDDLSLGYIDSKGEIRQNTIKEIDALFPEDLYDRVETLDAYIYSMKKDLPVEPILKLWIGIYDVLGIIQNSYEKLLMDEHIKSLRNSTVGHMVKLSQETSHKNSSSRYFYWVEIEKEVAIRRREGSFLEKLNYKASGIQLYINSCIDRIEFPGHFSLLTAPLRHYFKNNPFADNLSVEILPNRALSI